MTMNRAIKVNFVEPQSAPKQKFLLAEKNWQYEKVIVLKLFLLKFKFR